MKQKAAGGGARRCASFKIRHLLSLHIVETSTPDESPITYTLNPWKNDKYNYKHLWHTTSSYRTQLYLVPTWEGELGLLWHCAGLSQ